MDEMGAPNLPPPLAPTSSSDPTLPQTAASPHASSEPASPTSTPLAVPDFWLYPEYWKEEEELSQKDIAYLVEGDAIAQWAQA